MKIVIDLDEKYYNDIKNSPTASNYSTLYALFGIRNGTPLPKGHGRLIYAKDAIETLQIMFSGDEDIQNACEQCISDCPTIIEADKENKQ